jgi:EmrB/QacA subfamily drug resistance transporter
MEDEMSHFPENPAPGGSTLAVPDERWRRRLILLLTCSATAMVGLDTAIANVAVPSIQRELQVGPGTSQWVVVAYGLFLGGFLLLGGRLTDHVGRRRVLIIGLLVFTGASLAAGLAPDAGWLIAARGVQGLGAALVTPAALSLLAVTFAEGKERDRALGLFGAVGGGAGAVGVVVSGLLTAGPGWRWAFFVNVPLGLLMILLAVSQVTTEPASGRTGRLDVAGAIAVTAGLLTLVLALHQGAQHGWSDLACLGTLALAGVLLGAFVGIERRSATPLVPSATLRNRALVAANVTALLAFGALGSFIFAGSLLMQQALGYSPLQTGFAWLATTLTIIVVATVGSRLIAKLGVQPLLVTGLSAVALGALWLTRVPARADYAVDLLPALLLAGIGFGLCGPALQVGALTGVSRSAAGLASGLVETMTEIGGAVGVALVSTVLVAGSAVAGFHSAFAVTGCLAGLGVVASAVGFGRRHPTGRTGELQDAPRRRDECAAAA